MSNTTSINNSSSKLTDLQAERSVLGSCLIDPNAVIKVAPLLAADDFYRASHGDFFRAMLQLADAQKPIDATTLANQLERSGKLDDVGGYAGITDLFADVPTALYVEHYAAIVADKATKRRILAAAGAIAEAAYTDESAEMALDLAEQALLKVNMGKRQKNLYHIGEVLRGVVDTLGQAQEGYIVGLPTGFRDIDRILGGLQKSDLVLAAGRPGMGKSAWAVSVGLKAAKLYGARVAIFSLEMSKEQLVQRMLSMETKIESHRLRMRRIADEEWNIVLECANEIGSLPIYIDDSAGVSVDYARREARRLYAEHGLDLIIVDYLQLMSGETGKNGNREQEIAYISRNLKNMAKELNVPVIALSQLSRAVEARQDKRPMLSDLRESGSQEQDADIVLFLYRDDYYHEDSEQPNVAEVIIAKHRHGATGSVSLFFRKELTLFDDLEIERKPLN